MAMLQTAAQKGSETRVLLESWFGSVPGSFAVNYWDGVRSRFGTGEAEFTVSFNREPDLTDMLGSPSLFFGDGYMRGDVDVAGSFPAVAKALDAAAGATGAAAQSRFVPRAMALLSSAARSIARQKADIAAHYDLGNDFFSLWLDTATCSYSCAYFRNADDSLETAQQQKQDLVLRKLRLAAGMRILDIGCGWGGLSIGAAREYGAKVLAITLSEEQASAVRRRYEENGLSDVCEVRLCNYLELDPAEKFDRIVSVGMFEHVGKAHYSAYFGKVHDLLCEGGLSLLHTLTKNKPGETDPWIAKRIFPGGRIPAVAEIVSLLSDYDFHLLHVESLRRHYVRTLDAWYANFSRPDVLEKVRGMFDQNFIRMWSLYLRMAAAFLAIGDLDLHQFVFTKGLNDDLPMTLEDIYR